jgi:hypothetical protein
MGKIGFFRIVDISAITLVIANLTFGSLNNGIRDIPNPTLNQRAEAKFVHKFKSFDRVGLFFVLNIRRVCVSVKVSFSEGKTKGDEVNLPCISCTGKTAHKVVSSFDERGSDKNHGHSIEWSVDYQVVQCQGCKTVSFRQASSNSEACFPNGDGEWEYGVDERLFPSRLAGRKGLGEDTYYLPQNLKRIYDETLSALSSQSPVLAGIGLRALLETVCKEKSATGKGLFEKIDSLVTTNVLTPASTAILHKIRTLGNAAAHEVKPHSEKQLSLAMDIIEHLLRDVYILPKQVDSEF